MRKSTFLLPILVVVAAAILSSIFIVDERQKVLVLQFGRVVAVKQDPGLAFKILLFRKLCAMTTAFSAAMCSHLR